MNVYKYFYDLVQQIPKGRVTTYSALAEALGNKRLSRYVGYMLSKNPRPIEIPCHRVIRSDGKIGGFTHPEGVKRKEELLRKEGIIFDDGKIINFNNVFFNEFETSYPLKNKSEKFK